MNEENIPKQLTKHAIKELELLLEKIDAHEGPFFENRSTKEGDVIYYSPWSDPVTFDAMRFLNTNNLFIEFFWSGWQEGRDFFWSDDDSKYDDIDRQFTLKLLTAVARNSRFCEGAWAMLFDSGDAQKLFKRFLEIEKSAIK